MRIPNISEIRNKDYRVLIELGDIANSTRTPSSDFRAVRRRMFLSMVNNPQITDTAQLNETPERIDRQAQRFAQEQSPDLLDENLSSRGAASGRYDLYDTYVLSGTFGELMRGRQGTYIFDVTLTNVGSREIVFAEQMVSKEVR